MAKWILVVVIILVSGIAAVYAWWEYSPSRNVYEVDGSITGDPSDCAGDLRMAVIGDFGDASQREKDVANLVHRW